MDVTPTVIHDVMTVRVVTEPVRVVFHVRNVM